MRRTYWCVGLAALPALGQGAPWPTRVSTRAGSQAVTKDAAQHRSWSLAELSQAFYEVVNYNRVLLFVTLMR